MPSIVSVSTAIPPYKISNSETEEVVKELFKDSFADIERLLTIFNNGQIHKRHFVVPKEWFKDSHSFEEKNNLYIQHSVELGVEAIESCLSDKKFLNKIIYVDDIDAIFFVSSSGIATPTIDAWIMNELSFSQHTKRIPLWGLGCAGGGAGMSRAYEYCLAYPNAKVLLLCVELCSLTFQKDDTRKSNLVGTSLFADGVSCALIVGDEVVKGEKLSKKPVPSILGTQSTLMKNSLDVMGWHVNDHGLQVIFSKDIPTIVQQWLKPNIETFLLEKNIELQQIGHFVAHPGGKKVLDSYEKALGYDRGMTETARTILKNFGNMSSATILYVLKEFMTQGPEQGDLGLMTALGPGFSSELLLLEWRDSE
ncbi:alkylresorcinol/alkylpyrone synthase [Evansella vedderi]|uniref:Alkylresorcinol/alkylpyrone synthase n=2 Tax=Evansella vedderi TaxID=38282 RepID=A0ABT9ZTS0_9BACI|nr:alkylresorcinol/alkylpyrone synthase [Evansella vedderi]